eukprot:CAMPEP_0183453516 /NCGR_PEP_ID=MMETSP0370-20130417/121173_1 /TAXON_ID=268820 /ORGANISM="Peridinium aciculiferum, Strain PAER-2" /LENGTH=53 /DNA_ID=CAMNT_0025644919 /DNA_START=17 /DNA_END=178 /DNA_ORIENTATION=+
MPILAAASNTELQVLVLVQLKAGNAKFLALQYCNKLQASLPVMTPAFMPGISQ